MCFIPWQPVRLAPPELDGAAAESCLPIVPHDTHLHKWIFWGHWILQYKPQRGGSVDKLSTCAMRSQPKATAS